jgi:hypothetical protein
MDWLVLEHSDSLAVRPRRPRTPPICGARRARIAVRGINAAALYEAESIAGKADLSESQAVTPAMASAAAPTATEVARHRQLGK